MIVDYLLPWLFNWSPPFGDGTGADPAHVERSFTHMITVPSIVLLICMAVITATLSRSRPVLAHFAHLFVMGLVFASVIAWFEAVVFSSDVSRFHLGSFLFIVAAWLCSVLFLFTLLILRRPQGLRWWQVIVLSSGIVFWNLWSFAPLQVANWLYWDLFLVG